MTSPKYIVSALKHRPQTFAEVLAQEHITRTLKHSLERGQIANAYIFAGPRGTGKTTSARILAKALNCENLIDAEPCNECSCCKSINHGNFIDVLEIDAASNRGIDEIRNLRENVRFAPTQGKYKVYIIDEVHMLTDQAYNAFLKTLEEPPAHSRFILATTELHKIPNTILSRCQRFQFRRIPIQIIVDHLKRIILEQENLEIASPSELDRILYHLARASEGGLRDALVSLDQLLAFCSGKLNLTQVEEILGVIEFDLQDRFVRAILQHELPVILTVIEELTNRGNEISWFLKECMQFLRNLAVSKITKDTRELIDMPDDYRNRLQETAKLCTLEQILYITDIFWEAERRVRFSSESRMILEMAAIKAAKAGQAVKVGEILARLASGTLVMPSGAEIASVPAGALPPKETTIPVGVSPSQVAISSTDTTTSSAGSIEVPPSKKTTTPAEASPSKAEIHSTDTILSSKPAEKLPAKEKKIEEKVPEAPADSLLAEPKETTKEKNEIRKDNVVPLRKEPEQPITKVDVFTEIEEITTEETEQKDPAAPVISSTMSSAWNQILNEVENRDPFIAAALHGTKAVELTGDTLKVAIPAGNALYQRTLELPHNRMSIATMLKESFGRPIHVVYVIKAEEGAEEDTKTAPKDEPEPKHVNMAKIYEQLRKDAVFNKLQDELPGRILGIQPE